MKTNELLEKDNLFLLLKYFSNNKHMTSTDDLYDGMNKFLTQGLGLFPLLTFSCPEDLEHFKDKENSYDSFRTIWNRDAFNFYETEDINKILSFIGQKYKSSKYFYEYDLNGNKYYIFIFGSNSGQRFFGIFSSGNKGRLDNEFLEFLFKHSRGSFENIQRWKTLSQYSELIHVDDVTGLFNQRKLLKDLDYLISKYESFNDDFVVIFIDIDHFKNVNDGHGHLVGTKLLTEMANILRMILRESDLVYRYGGDEFVMLVPNVTIENAKAIGHRILHTVSNHVFEVEESSKFNLTVSIGISNFANDAKDKNDVLAIADQMMYNAKESGRGRVCMAGELFT